MPCPTGLTGIASDPRRAFTILEVMVAVFILAILAAFLLPNLGSFTDRARETQCMANLRSIHLGLSSYLSDHGRIWPQGPSPANEGPWSEFWLKTLEPYHVTPETWQCPGITALLKKENASPGEIPPLHYLPTMFDDQPGTAYRWPTQPWLIERANAHGRGTLICFPDGSVKPLSKVLAEQGQR
jgi:prepilin-type N-terminal cleavage/methylation domain-containing protein